MVEGGGGLVSRPKRALMYRQINDVTKCAYKGGGG